MKKYLAVVVGLAIVLLAAAPSPDVVAATHVMAPAQAAIVYGGKLSIGCALAVAGTLGTTVGAIWVSSGTALIYWATMKGLATATLIDACS